MHNGLRTTETQFFFLHIAKKHRSCDAQSIGAGWSGHYLCADMLEKVIKDTCQFISFGISDVYSFEKVLSKKYGCHGFSADPTVR